LQADPRASRDQPAEVSRSRRAAHLAIQLTALFPLACCTALLLWILLLLSPLLAPFSNVSHDISRGERVLQDLETGAAKEFAAAELSPNPWVRLTAACQWDADQRLADRVKQRLEEDRHEQQARGRCMTGFSYGLPKAGIVASAPQVSANDIVVIVGPKGGQRASARWLAQSAVNASRVPSEEGSSVPLSVVVTLAVVLLLGVLSAFVTRGGVTFPLAGIRVVRSDGRLASRTRCAWRALIAWAPVIGFILLAIALDTWQLGRWRQGPSPWLPLLASLSWIAAVAVMALHVVAALWSPDRSWHDRLARTCLVPR
jgi:hypothetical protein